MSPTLPARYRLLDLGPDPAGGPLADEILPDHAAAGPAACLWQSPQGLVVPRTYAARPGFEAACAASAARGWPVEVRQSGGGVVPQGPGILNLSLAQVLRGRPLDYSEALYQRLCGMIAGALLFSGIEARAQAVEGSFCDGRFNLAVGSPARKVAGTAQWWRRLPAQPRRPAPGDAGAAGSVEDRPDPQAESHVGLVHALILAACDTREATAQANALEAALGNSRRYDPDAVASLDRLTPPGEREGFATRLRDRLAAMLRRQELE
ncbi:MAG TPA: lipoate--protein ligase family protein [Castellaniella sp.]|jgi:hypothetical protein|nr:lipoate--protein ligase family protein [Castellaniella sp.]